jgi:transposase InsO family protein
MTRESPTWGQERIANELLLKLGLRVSPRTVRKCMPKRLDRGPSQRMQSQRWSTFLRNHAKVMIACDFCAPPTAAWTLQQLRDAIPSNHTYRFLIHDRDRIFSQPLDQHIRRLGLRLLKTRVRRPQANALCERLLGTLWRECLDFIIPLTETH